MKKIIYCFALLLLPVAGTAQQITYNISGKIKGAAKGMSVYLHYNGNIQDSASLTNGRFVLKGSTDRCRMACLQLRYTSTPLNFLAGAEDQLPFYLNEDKITIRGNTRIETARISGSSMNDGYRHYLAYMNEKTAGLVRARILINKTIEITPDGRFKRKDWVTDTYADSLQNIIKEESPSEIIFQEEYIKNNHASPFTLIVLRDIYTGSMPKYLDKSISLFETLDPSIKNSEEAQQFRMFLQKHQNTTSGNIAPDFSLPDVQGNEVKLSDYRGNYVLLDFWASWCMPCRSLNQDLAKTYEKYKDKGFTVLSVSLDDNKEKWLKAIKDDKLPWSSHVSDLKGWKNEVAALYGVKRIPYNLLLDPDGKIVARNKVGDVLDSLLSSGLDSRRVNEAVITGRINPVGDLMHVDQVNLAYNANGEYIKISSPVIN